MSPTAIASGHRFRVESALAAGWRFGGLHASADGTVVHTLFVGEDGATRLDTTATGDGGVPSIVELVPAAAWDEREAHDLYGVQFHGHEPMRPLVDHTTRLDAWTVPVRGDDPYQVAVGPIHAGVIESGHFRFHVVGDRVLHLDPRLFYKHRGLERAAEGSTLERGLAFAARACGACAVSNSVAYVQACEQALGLVPSGELARVRTLLLELERVWSHLNDVAAICAGVGLAAGNTRFAALSEQARRLNGDLTGHRLLFGTVQLGESTLAVRAAAIERARATLATIRQEALRAWRELLFNATFQDRLAGVGILTRDRAAALGATGPAARAAGLGHDVRGTSPRLAYASFVPALPERAAGDVQARFEQRARELWQSLDLLDALLDRPFDAAGCVPAGSSSAIGIGLVESPRGATSCVVERSGDLLTRLRLRTGSYANWPVLAHVATDCLLPDFPLINKSFELCYACVDR